MPDAPPGVRAGVEIAIGVVRDARRARRGVGSGELAHERAWVMGSRIHLVTQAPLSLVGMLPPLCYLPSRPRTQRGGSLPTRAKAEAAQACTPMAMRMGCNPLYHRLRAPPRWMAVPYPLTHSLTRKYPPSLLLAA